MGDIVILQQSELMFAAYCGSFRRSSAIGRGSKDLDHPCKTPWENDVVSAQGELSVSRYLNLSWSGVTRDHKADVGDWIEVRTVTDPADHLIVRSRDERHGNLGKPFVSVYAKDDKFEMRGWLFGTEVKIEKNRRRPNGGSECWMADNDDLHDMDDLFMWVNNQTKLLKT